MHAFLRFLTCATWAMVLTTLISLGSPPSLSHAQDFVEDSLHQFLGQPTPQKQQNTDQDKELPQQNTPGGAQNKGASPSYQGGIRLFPDKLVWPQIDTKEGTGVWLTFFDREEVKFDLEAFLALPHLLFTEVGAVVVNREQAWQHRWPKLVAALLALLILIGGFIWADRRLWERRDALLKMIGASLPDSTLLHQIVGTTLRLCFWAMPAFALQVLAAIVAAFFNQEQSPLALAIFEGLWFFLGYRLVVGALHELFGRPDNWLSVPPDDVSRLRAFLIWVLRGVLALQAARLSVRIAMGGPDLEATLWSLSQLLLLITSAFLVWLKREVFTLLPSPSGNTLWASLRSRIERHYNTVLGITMGLQAMWLLGYVNAATFLLSRGYALLALVALWATSQARLANWLSPRIATAESEEQRESLARTAQALRFGLGSFFLFLALLVVGLWPYVRVLLQYRLLVIGEISLSIYRLGTAVIIFATFVLVSRVLRTQLMDRVYPRVGLDVAMGYAINTVAHYGLLSIGALTALATLGVNLGALTLFAGALSVGIGFGLQDITRNLVSGFILLLGRSVKKGDYVQVDAHFGRVEAMGARSVQIVTPDNTEIVIPSSRLVSETIINYTYSNPRIRLHIPVGVHYQSNVRVVEQALLNAALRHASVLRNPRPSVHLVEFGDNSVNFELLVWIDVRRIDPPRLRGELYFHIWDILQEQGVEVPYPQRDLHLRAGDELEDLIRALRGEARKPTQPTPPAPALNSVESYLSRYDQRPRFHIDPSSSLIESFVGFESFHAQRQEAIQRVAIRFLKTHQVRINEVARATRDTLQAWNDDELDTRLIDAALTHKRQG